MKLTFTIVLLCLSLLGKLYAQAGPYAPPAEQNGSTAIHKDSAVFTSWATACIVTRGLQDISDTSSGDASVGTDSSAIDTAGLNGVVSLGDGGSAILTFTENITNGTGADFAVFENSFSDTFLELAFVEVSSDGINFFRFDAISLIDADTQIDGFGSSDATEIYNLAGKYKALYGTPFDLDELVGTVGLDVNAVSHVKIIDVIGNISIPSYTSYDSQNNPINDPWPTPFASSGFDLDAVGVINSIPTSVNAEKNAIQLSIYPNPTNGTIYFNFENQKEYSYNLTNVSGSEIKKGIVNKQLDISYLDRGIYFIKISSNNNTIVKKIVKN